MSHPSAGQGAALAAHRHVGFIADTPEEAYRLLLPFASEGLTVGEKAFHIVDRTRRSRHLGRLARAGVKVQRALASGQLEVRTWDDTYLSGGRFDPDAMLALLEGVFADARAQGRARARLIGHMEWALEGRPGVGQLLAYEARINDLAARHPDSVVCVYDRRAFGEDVLRDVLRTHPVAIVDGVLRESPSFVPPDAFLAERRRRVDALGWLRERYLTLVLGGRADEALDLVVEHGLWQDLPVSDICLEVLAPAQVEIGRLWQARRVGVSEEHQATAVAGRALTLLRPHLPEAPANGGTAVVACPEGERHDIGARMIGDFLGAAGFEVCFLGADVPTTDLLAFVKGRGPALLALSSTTRVSLRALRHAVARVRALPRRRPLLAVGGRTFHESPGLVAELGVDLHASDARAFVDVVGRHRARPNGNGTR